MNSLFFIVTAAISWQWILAAEYSRVQAVSSSSSKQTQPVASSRNSQWQWYSGYRQGGQPQYINPGVQTGLVETSCGGGNCNPEIPCTGGGCDIDIREPVSTCNNGGCLPQPRPLCGGSNCGTDTCTGSNCGSTCTGTNCGTSTCTGIGCVREPYQPTQTCNSCISGCTGGCSTNQCVNSCLNSCSCNNEPIIQPNNNRCCDVLHPRTCFTEESGRSRCIVRRHRECSDLCSSSVVSLQPSQQVGNTGCTYIRNYPYIYCGNYETQNCGGCYSCNGVYDPYTCSRSSGCSQGCRNTLPYVYG